jgi:hypothetical protein
MSNLQIYDKVRVVPKTALKDISAGRLKGMSDINPMWRIKILTETFGVCGFGWKYEIIEERLEEEKVNDEIAAFVRINLYIKMDGEWSAPIPGTGGSAFVAKESRGPYVSDECFKMALTDALSVACKALGVGADIYYGRDETKYAPKPQQPKPVAQTPPTTPVTKPEPPQVITPNQAADLVSLCSQKGYALDKIMKVCKVTELADITTDLFAKAIKHLESLADVEQ